ncbi:MAG: DUF2460 domain-containing protein [Litorimonas sp.]
MIDFHDVRFPLHLAFGTRGGPARTVDIVQLANGTEVRNAKGQHSRRQYNAVAGLKSREQAIELLNFYESRFGPLYGFRFHDPLDFEADGVLGVGDGERTEFALIKQYGTFPHMYNRRITKPVSGTVNVTVAGEERPVSVDHQKGVIQFQSAPNAGEAISSKFEFDVPVRFESQSLDIGLDDFGSTQIQDIPLIEILSSEALSHV